MARLEDVPRTSDLRAITDGYKYPSFDADDEVDDADDSEATLLGNARSSRWRDKLFSNNVNVWSRTQSIVIEVRIFAQTPIIT